MTAIRIMTTLFIGMTILGLNLAPNCMASAYGNANLLNQLNGIIQNPVVSCQNEKKKILCLPLEYSKFDLPVRNEANFIDIGIEISDVLKIDDKDYSITFSLYFNVQWSEPRLNLSQEFFNSENITGDEQLVPVNLELIHDLWVPNIYIYNLKSFKVIDVLSKLAGLWINNKKEVYYSQATHITFICPMLFDSFPLDTQVCKFQVGSYSYDMTKMLFRVSKLTFIQKQSIILDYNIRIRDLPEIDRTFLAGALGNYSLAGFEMNLERHVMSYIITYYLPSGLFVVVSWISFLIPPDIVPGRMALLITLFLVLINIFNNITTNSPKAEGLTAIEIWMLACILFVFGSLIEYAVILFKKQKVSKYGVPSQSAYSERATAAMAIASATQNAAAGAFTLGGLATLGRGLSSSASTPKISNTATNRNIRDEFYDTSPTAQQVYEDASNQYLLNQYESDQASVSPPDNRSCHAQNGSNNGAGIIPSNMTNSTTIGPTPQQAPPPAHRCPTPPKKVHKFTETSKFKDSATETETTITGGIKETTFGGGSGLGDRFISSDAPKHNHKNSSVSFVYKTKDQGCRHQRFDDTLRRKRKQSAAGKHYSTWHDKYGPVDRFFLVCSPFLFLVFNVIYWSYFYFWKIMVRWWDGEDDTNTIQQMSD